VVLQFLTPNEVLIVMSVKRNDISPIAIFRREIVKMPNLDGVMISGCEGLITVLERRFAEVRSNFLSLSSSLQNTARSVPNNTDCLESVFGDAKQRWRMSPNAKSTTINDLLKLSHNGTIGWLRSFEPQFENKRSTIQLNARNLGF